MFLPQRIEEVHMVQYVPDLEKAYATWATAKHTLDDAIAIRDKAQKDGKLTDKEKDAVKEAKEKAEKLAKQVDELWKQAAQKAEAGEGNPNGHTASVKFKTARKRE